MVRHARYVTFQLAEVAVPRRLYQAILDRIRRVAAIPPRATPIGPGARGDKLTKAEGATLRLSTILGQNNGLGILNADFALIQRRSSRKRAF
jgi:hypothetical protein